MKIGTVVYSDADIEVVTAGSAYQPSFVLVVAGCDVETFLTNEDDAIAAAKVIALKSKIAELETEHKAARLVEGQDTYALSLDLFNAGFELAKLESAPLFPAAISELVVEAIAAVQKNDRIGRRHLVPALNGRYHGLMAALPSPVG